MNIFKHKHFPSDIILLSVRWYCKYALSYRNLEEMLEERGVELDHSTVNRWVVFYAPQLAFRLKKYGKPKYSKTWYVDETYIKIKGEWFYLYRAINKKGDTIDFHLSKSRDTRSAEQFLKKSIKGLKKLELPRSINTDQHPAYDRAIRLLRVRRELPKDIEHRKVKYLNNRIESDHGKLKRLIKPTLGFKAFHSARATIEGFEVMRMFHKGQFKGIKNVRDEVRFISKIMTAC